MRYLYLLLVALALPSTLAQSNGKGNGNGKGSSTSNGNSNSQSNGKGSSNSNAETTSQQQSASVQPTQKQQAQTNQQQQQTVATTTVQPAAQQQSVQQTTQAQPVQQESGTVTVGQTPTTYSTTTCPIPYISYVYPTEIGTESTPITIYGTGFSYGSNAFFLDATNYNIGYSCDDTDYSLYKTYSNGTDSLVVNSPSCQNGDALTVHIYSTCNGVDQQAVQIHPQANPCTTATTTSTQQPVPAATVQCSSTQQLCGTQCYNPSTEYCQCSTGNGIVQSIASSSSSTTVYETIIITTEVFVNGQLTSETTTTSTEQATSAASATQPATGNSVSTSSVVYGGICAQIYQEGSQDATCNILNPQTGQYFQQCYNPICYNCTSTGQLCPANAPLSCGAACYDPGMYSCNVNNQNYFASTLQQVPNGKSTLTLNPYCPGSGSPLAGTTPNTTVVSAPSAGQSIQGTASGAIVPQTAVVVNSTANSVCGQIYQEGAQDHTCNVLNPATGQSTPQCYNPACYNCTAQYQLCPSNYPLSCGLSCYDPNEYTCNVNQNNYYASTLQQIPGGSHTLTLNPYCPGSGSPLAGTTPNTTIQSVPTPPATGTQCISTVAAAPQPVGNLVSNTTDICSKIYQEGAQDHSCTVIDQTTGQSFVQCYNPACYNCTSTGQLCPANFPYACGAACYDPNEYSCNINSQHYFASTLVQIPGGSHSLTLNPYCPGSGSPLAGTTPNTTTVTPPSTGASVSNSTSAPSTTTQNTYTQPPAIVPASAVANGSFVPTSTSSTGICSQIYQEGAQDHACNVIDPQTGSYFQQCYNPTCYNCTSTGQLCPANAPLSCGAACYDPGMYSCNVNNQNYFASTLKQVPNGKSTLTLNEYCPGSGSPLAGTTPTTATVPAIPGNQVVTTCSVAAPPAVIPVTVASSPVPTTVTPTTVAATTVTPTTLTPTTTVIPTTLAVTTQPATKAPVSNICSQIYQEGAQDHSCNVINPSTGQYTLQCYNPACYNCTTYGTLCPANFPLSCGAACYDPSQYSCNINVNNFFASTLVQIAGGQHTLSLNPYCPGSGSPLAGTTPNTTVVVAPSTGAAVIQSTPAPTTVVPTTTTPTTVTPTTQTVTTPPATTPAPTTPVKNTVSIYTPQTTQTQAVTPNAVVPTTTQNQPMLSSGSCAQIYQEGAQDSTCNVMNTVTGQTTAYCYNPSCYNCTATGFLCPSNTPLSCGAACYDPSQYSCIVNQNNMLASQLYYIANAPPPSLQLPAYCPGSGSPLAGTTPGTMAVPAFQ